MQRARDAQAIDLKDWRLSAFRWGLLACIVWAIFIAVHFDIVDFVSAIINGNPTTAEVDAANLALARKDVACTKVVQRGLSVDYPPSCSHDTIMLHGLPRDQAIWNIEFFCGGAFLLLVAIGLLARIGIEMNREARRPRSSIR
jgi:hypothetical protein